MRILTTLVLCVMLLAVAGATSAQFDGGVSVDPGATITAPVGGMLVVGDVEVRNANQSIKVYLYDNNAELRGEVTSVPEGVDVFFEWGGTYYSTLPNVVVPTTDKIGCQELLYGCGDFCRGVALHQVLNSDDGKLTVTSKYMDPKLCLVRKCTWLPTLGR